MAKVAVSKSRTVACPVCGKEVKARGLYTHAHFTHGHQGPVQEFLKAAKNGQVARTPPKPAVDPSKNPLRLQSQSDEQSQSSPGATTTKVKEPKEDEGGPEETEGPEKPPPVVRAAPRGRQVLPAASLPPGAFLTITPQAFTVNSNFVWQAKQATEKVWGWEEMPIEEWFDIFLCRVMKEFGVILGAFQVVTPANDESEESEAA